VVSSATRALLSLTTPIGGEAKVALHYLLAADVPSFGEGVAKLRAKTGPDLTIVDRKIQSGDFDELSD
jgi:hypothetical protein